MIVVITMFVLLMACLENAEKLGDPIGRHDFILAGDIKKRSQRYWKLPPFEDWMVIDSKLYQGDIITSQGMARYWWLI